MATCLSRVTQHRLKAVATECMNPKIVNSFAVSLQIIICVISQASNKDPDQVDNKSY